jgi:hypothetical protein
MQEDHTGGGHRPQGIRAGGIAVAPDDQWPDMWRVRWRDGRTSDFANLTRCNDAALGHLETLERQKRRAAQPQRRPPVRFNGSEVRP